MSKALQRIAGWFVGDVGIDLGTTTTLIYARGKGIVSAEPSVVALDRRTNSVIAVGAAAQMMLERTPPEIVASRPVQGGVIADFRTVEQLLAHCMRTAGGPRPRVVVGVPSGVTTVERDAAKTVAEQVGARRAFLVDEPLAAAIGAGLPVDASIGSMIVDIGGGTTEVAVIALGGMVVYHSTRIAGDMLDEAVVQFAQHQYDLLIGAPMAERAKITAGSAHPSGDGRSAVLRGRDLATGLPKAVEVPSGELRAGIAAPVARIVDVVRAALDETPPELLADIMEQGITLVGGGSLLHGLVERLHVETRVPVQLANDPLSCVVRGVGQMVEALTSVRYRQVLEHAQRSGRRRPSMPRSGWRRS